MFHGFRSRFGRNVELTVLTSDRRYYTELAEEHPSILGLLRSKKDHRRVWIAPPSATSFAVQHRVPYCSDLDELWRLPIDDKPRMWGLLPPMKSASVLEGQLYLLSTNDDFLDWLSYLSATRSDDDALQEIVADIHSRISTQLDVTVDEVLEKWERLDERDRRVFNIKHFLSRVFPNV